MLDSSCSESVSPPSSTATSALADRRRGSPRRSSKSACRYCDEFPHLSRTCSSSAASSAGRDDRVRPLAEAGAVGDGNAEQLGDHRDRQREGELADRSISPRASVRRALVGDLLDPRPQLLDHPRRERLRDQAAQAAVVVAVAVEHVAVDELEGRQHRLRGQLVLRQREPLVADEALVVEQHRGGVLVAGDEPDHALAVDAGLADDRVMLAHLREDALRIGAKLRPVQVVLALRRRHFQPA